MPTDDDNYYMRPHIVNRATFNETAFRTVGECQAALALIVPDKLERPLRYFIRLPASVPNGSGRLIHVQGSCLNHPELHWDECPCHSRD